jgi:hypothetical protein
MHWLSQYCIVIHAIMLPVRGENNGGQFVQQWYLTQGLQTRRKPLGFHDFCNNRCGPVSIDGH